MVFPRQADISHTSRQMGLWTTGSTAAAPAATATPATPLAWAAPWAPAVPALVPVAHLVVPGLQEGWRRQGTTGPWCRAPAPARGVAAAATATTRPPLAWWEPRKIPTGVRLATNFWLLLCDPQPMQPMLLVSYTVRNGVEFFFKAKIVYRKDSIRVRFRVKIRSFLDPQFFQYLWSFLIYH